MKATKTILTLLGVVGLATAAILAPSRSSQPIAHGKGEEADLSTGVVEDVSLSGAAEDGKAVFQLVIYRPWPEAEQRVLLFSCGSVGQSGLASHTTLRLTDLGAESETLVSDGAMHRCKAHLNVESWVAVDSKDDIRLEIVRKEQ
jgi:hypothetical protein